MNLKQIIYKTPAAKLAKDTEALFQLWSLGSKSRQIIANKTIYCISPYKTGTTFLSSSFNPEISQHEPYQYLTLKKLDQNFDEFFVRRLNKLNLKLECSGFWSAYVDQLSSHEIASELEYICILRSPSSWITSVINYWNRPYIHSMNFEYLNDLFWKPKVGVDIREILDFNNQGNEAMISKLAMFYLDFTRNTQKLKNIYYINLHELREALPVLASMIDENPDFSKLYTREARNKVFRYVNEDIDRAYLEIIAEFETLPVKSLENIQ